MVCPGCSKCCTGCRAIMQEERLAAEAAARLAADEAIRKAEAAKREEAGKGEAVP